MYQSETNSAVLEPPKEDFKATQSVEHYRRTLNVEEAKETLDKYHHVKKYNPLSWIRAAVASFDFGIQNKVIASQEIIKKEKKSVDSLCSQPVSD